MKRTTSSTWDNSVFRFNEIHFDTKNILGYKIKRAIKNPYPPFIMPVNISQADGFRILSYLIEKIQRDLSLSKCSKLSIDILNDNLRYFQFRPVLDNISLCTELFYASDNIREFKNSRFNKKGVCWFTTGVKFKEIQKIYRHAGYNISEPYFNTDGKLSLNSTIKYYI